MSFYPTTESLPPLGALCLDYTDDIHRPPGDVIESSSYEFPVIKKLIKGANLWKIVNPAAFPEDYLQLFVKACRELQEEGCIGIITSCGFLAQIQARLADQISLPIATSSLIQVPFILGCISSKKNIAVLTFDESVLNKVHFNGVGISDHQMERLIVKGCPPDGVLHDIIVRGKPYIHEQLEQELVTLAKTTLENHPEVAAIVLECTQMPPFAQAIQKEVNLPVYDGITMVNWFYSGLCAKMVPPDLNKEDGLRERKRGINEEK